MTWSHSLQGRVDPLALAMPSDDRPARTERKVLADGTVIYEWSIGPKLRVILRAFPNGHVTVRIIGLG